MTLLLLLLLAIPTWATDPFLEPPRVNVAEIAAKLPRAAIRQPRTPQINSVLAAAQATFAPVPPGSLPICKNCSTKGYDQIQITPDVWAITEGMYFAMVVVSTNNNKYGSPHDKKARTLAVIDAPPTITKYVDAIEELLVWTGATTVTDFILSHHHKDHIDGGNAVVAKWPQARVIAHEAVYQILTDGRSLGNRPIPTVTFKKDLSLPTYGLELSYPGQTHSTGNIIVFHPKSKTILFIDVIFPKWVPFKNLAVSENIPAFVKAYQLILDFDFTTIIGGHLTTVGNRDDVLQGQQYVNDVVASAQHALATVDGNQIAADMGVFDPTNQNYGNWWGWFAEYLDALAEFCYEEVKPKWLGVIGAVDVFTLGHCDTAVESLRID